eukprot:scaffold12139_cov60-Cyclotella_meneghiniana.AAC.3
MNLQQQNHRKAPDGTIILCSTCDHCRARKVKCDGNYPCGHCVAKYKRENKLKSVEGVDAAELNCVYAPAKQRGPIPGKAAARKLGVELNRVSTSSSAGEEYSLNRLDSFSIDDHPTDTESQTDDILTGEPSTAAGGGESFNKTILSLRSWMDKTLHLIAGNINKDDGNRRVAITSDAYLQSALKIASCLARQIIQAQDSHAENDDAMSVNDSLLLLPQTNSNDQDWTTYVTVQLGSLNEDNNELVSLPENEALESFLRSSEEDAEYNAPYRQHDETDVANGCNDQGNKITEIEGDVKDHSTAFAGDDVEDHATASKAKQSCNIDRLDNVRWMHDDVNYLSIETATIQCHGGKQINGNADIGKDRLRRIHNLGLVFYELFTGGELPPESIPDLSSCENAFDSLSTLSLVKENNEDPTPNVMNKRHQGPSLSVRGIGLCESSCEYLKVAGVTSPLCDLIFNMLDSVYGDLSGKESYTNMTDVAFDLQLMIDKPSKFLKRLDTDQLSKSGLPIDDLEIPREEEFNAIKSCYHRSVLGSSEIAIIKGESGTGKSSLAYRIGSYVIKEGGLFLTGKFDQILHHDQAKPFSALAAAFDQYCELLLLLKESDCTAFQLIVESLKSALGQDEDLHPLFKVIPKLRNILGESIELGDSLQYDISVKNKNWGNTFSRLQFLLSKFVSIISVSSVVSVVIFMDDLQWIDQSSLDILKTILRHKHTKFFFIGCCRNGEMASDHSFWKMMESINTVGVGATQVKLNRMNEKTLKSVVSELLCLSPRLVRPLASILFSRSKGNTLFFVQLMMLLHRNGMLFLDFGRQRWAWDEEKIVSMKLPDNIAICLTNDIGKLPSEVQLALNTLAMFGASAKVSYLKLLESQFQMKLLEPLKEAEGLVTNSNGSFHFCHDCIQEVALNLIEEQDRRSKHLAYGKCLVKKALDEKDNYMLFTAVDQINLGGPSAVTDYSDYFGMANYNLLAGKQSMNMAEFSSALSFFMNGIAYLRDGHWRDHYSLSLEIYEMGCRSADAATNMSCLDVLSERVLKEARSFEDTLEIQLIRMNMFANSMPTEALNLGLSIVSKLGEEIPSITKEALDLKQVQAMIGNISGEHFLNYGIMTDTKKLFVMRSQFHTASLSPQAPLTFAYFGAYLARLGDLSTGYRFVMLGKTLLNKLGAREQTGEASEIQMYVEPSLSVLEVQQQGERAALLVGDMLWACLNRHMYCQYGAGLHNDLAFVGQLFSKARVFFEQQEHIIALGHNVITHRVVLTALGKTEEAMALENRYASIINLPIPHLARSITFHNLYLSYFMNTGNLIECFNASVANEVEEYFLIFGRSIEQYFLGLAAFRIYRQTEHGSSWNFEHKLQLMEAECYYCNGNFKKAAELYKKATISAKASKSFYAEGLANELAGKFFLETDNMSVSLEYLKLAHEKYCEWKAEGKANQLVRFICENFAVDCNFQPLDET